METRKPTCNQRFLQHNPKNTSRKVASQGVCCGFHQNHFIQLGAGYADSPHDPQIPGFGRNTRIHGINDIQNAYQSDYRNKAVYENRHCEKGLVNLGILLARVMKGYVIPRAPMSGKCQAYKAWWF